MPQERPVVPSPLFRLGLQCALAGVLLAALPSCAIVVDRGDDTRDFYVIGYARVRLPNASATGANARVIELSGVGIAISHAFQLGYFKEFQASVKPETNSAVIILRTDAEVTRLEALLKELNQNGLCLIIKDQRS